MDKLRGRWGRSLFFFFFSSLFWCLCFSAFRSRSLALISGFSRSCCFIHTWWPPSSFSYSQPLPHAGEGASDGKGAAGTDEPWEEHFCANIANDRRLNRNTAGKGGGKADPEQYLEIELSSTTQLMFTLVVWFPAIKEMKNLLIFKRFERTPIIPVLDLVIFAKRDSFQQNESHLGWWGPRKCPCQALIFRERKGPLPIPPPLPGEQLQAAAQRKFSRPQTLTEVCLRICQPSQPQKPSKSYFCTKWDHLSI